jgi:hypothetical protein
LGGALIALFAIEQIFVTESQPTTSNE